MKYPSKVKQNDDEKQLIRWAPTVNTQEQNTWNSLFSLGVQLGYYVLALHVCWDIGPPEIWLSGWWYTYPSEKYEFVSRDDDIPNIWKVIKFMFQTSNQI